MSAFTRTHDSLKEPAFALMRIVIGLLFFYHGIQKLFGYNLPPGIQIPIWSQAWIGGVIELVGGLLVAGGLFARCAAFVCSGEMAVAYVQFHWKLQMGEKFLPGVNGGEPALAFCVIFFYIACRGAGIFSIDQTLRGKK